MTMAKKKTIEQLEKELADAKKALQDAKRERARQKAAAKKTRTAPKAQPDTTDPASKSSSKVALMKNGKRMTGPAAVKVRKRAGADYTLMKDIKSSPMYGKTNRDPYARQLIDDNCQKVPRNKIVPGQLVLFEYFDPKTKDKLEYYDASPCTIFFGVFRAKQGKRIIGFNIHYYPPRLRYAIMDKIFKIYKPVYTKYFTTGTTREIDAFDYAYLVSNL